MTKNSIYSLLTLDFWTKRSCSQCHQYFTPSDYQTQNYQLYFTEVLKINQHSLTATFQLSHKSCCQGCISYLQDLKLCSTLIAKNVSKKKTPSPKRNH